MSWLPTKKTEEGDAWLAPWALAILALIFIIGVVARVYGIDRQSLWGDELFAVTASYKPFPDAWQMMIKDSHPPGYLSFMWLTLPITGYSDFGVRLHALLFGVTWMPLVFLFCRRWFSLSAALIALAVTACSYTAIYYSQEARAYSMLGVFCLLNVMCFFEIIFSDRSTQWHKIGFVASAIALLYLHYSGFVFLCAEIALCIGLMLWGRCRGKTTLLLLMFGVPLLAYLPWAHIMYANLTNAPPTWAMSEKPTLPVVYDALRSLLGPAPIYLKFQLFSLAGAILLAMILHVRNGLTVSLLALYSVVWLVIVPILAFYVESWVGMPLFKDRYMITSAVLNAVLIGWLGGWLIGRLNKIGQRKFFAALAVLVIAVWTLRLDVEWWLYSKKNKDPIREAVNLIKEDVSQNAIGRHYTTIMTHYMFEHYLKRAGVRFDADWAWRRYLIPQRVEEVENYLEAHKGKTYLYYLSLREPVSRGAVVELLYRYKLVSQVTLSCAGAACNIDIYKFNTKELPSAEQIRAAGTTPTNEMARLIAQDINGRDASAYYVLLTHGWMRSYLLRNGVALDGEKDSHRYVVNSQADNVYQYIENHPAVETLYYLALQEVNTEGAELMLQLRYHLVGEKTVDTGMGKLSLLTYKVKEPPVIDESAMQRMRASRTYSVVEQLKTIMSQTPSGTPAIATANAWIESYLKLDGLPIDDSWQGRRLRYPSDMPNVRDYLNQHPNITTLYYVALRDSWSEQVVQLLQKEYSLTSRSSVDVAVGTVDILQFTIIAKK